MLYLHLCLIDLSYLLHLSYIFHLVSVLHVQSLQNSINKAVAYLEKRLPSLINPYSVAMTSYALANENKLNKEILFKFISSGGFTQLS